VGYDQMTNQGAAGAEQPHWVVVVVVVQVVLQQHNHVARGKSCGCRLIPPSSLLLRFPLHALLR
jgi:hypothetical protein